MSHNHASPSRWTPALYPSLIPSHEQSCHGLSNYHINLSKNQMMLTSYWNSQLQELKIERVRDDFRKTKQNKTWEIETGRRWNKTKFPSPRSSRSHSLLRSRMIPQFPGPWVWPISGDPTGRFFLPPWIVASEFFIIWMTITYRLSKFLCSSLWVRMTDFHSLSRGESEYSFGLTRSSSRCSAYVKKPFVNIPDSA
jgi:hypothetical protein